jgi:hypothetical protein
MMSLFVIHSHLVLLALLLEPLLVLLVRVVTHLLLLPLLEYLLALPAIILQSTIVFGLSSRS